MLERHGLSNSKDFTLIIALPLLLAETTFSCQHPPTNLRRKAQFIDARSTATVRCSLWAEACRSGSTASSIPTASRPEIQWRLRSTDRDAFTCRMTMALPGRIRLIVSLLQAGLTSFQAGFTSVDSPRQLQQLDKVLIPACEGRACACRLLLFARPTWRTSTRYPAAGKLAPRSMQGRPGATAAPTRWSTRLSCPRKRASRTHRRGVRRRSDNRPRRLLDSGSRALCALGRNDGAGANCGAGRR